MTAPMYLVLDTETTGLPKYDLPADHPDQPHIAAVAMIFVDAELKIEREYETLIRPDGWEMESDAMAVNGLTMERLEAEGIPILEALAIYAEAIDAGRIVVAHNARFDVKMMRGELRRAKLDDRFDRTKNICTMRGCIGVVKAAPTNSMMAGGRKTFKMPKLAEAYEHFFKCPIEGAHSALVDARACFAIFRKLVKIGCCPEPEVHHAKEGTEAAKALATRQSGPGGDP